MRLLLIAFLCFGLAVAADGAWAQKTELNSVYDIAKKRGVKKCLARLRDLSSDIIKGRPHDAKCSSTKNPDGGQFNCSTVIQVEENLMEFAGISVIPTASGQCTGEFTRAIRFSKSCTEVQRDHFADFTRDGGNEGMFFLHSPTGGGGSAMTLMEMPAKNCVVILRRAL